MMDKVWLVVGSTGEYSDHSSWIVAAYPDEEPANQHAELANNQLKDNSLHSTSQNVPGNVAAGEFVGKFYLDPQCRIDYTGTEYYVTEVPLVLHVDQYMERFPHKEG